MMGLEWGPHGSEMEIGWLCLSLQGRQDDVLGIWMVRDLLLKCLSQFLSLHVLLDIFLNEGNSESVFPPLMKIATVNLGQAVAIVLVAH